MANANSKNKERFHQFIRHQFRGQRHFSAVPMNWTEQRSTINSIYEKPIALHRLPSTRFTFHVSFFVHFILDTYENHIDWRQRTHKYVFCCNFFSKSLSRSLAHSIHHIIVIIISHFTSVFFFLLFAFFGTVRLCGRSANARDTDVRSWNTTHSRNEMKWREMTTGRSDDGERPVKKNRKTREEHEIKEGMKEMMT